MKMRKWMSAVLCAAILAQQPALWTTRAESVPEGAAYTATVTEPTAAPESELPAAEPTAVPESEPPAAEPTAAPEAEPPAVEPPAAPESEPPAAEPPAAPESEPPAAEPTAAPEAELPAVEPTAAPEAEPPAVELHAVLAFETMEGGLYVAGCDPLCESVVVPAVCNGLPVLAIGEEAFADCAQLQRVTVEEGILAIHARAFADCEKLTVVALPQTVEQIAPDAFEGCAALRGLDAPEGSYACAFSAACFDAAALSAADVQPADGPVPSPLPDASLDVLPLPPESEVSITILGGDTVAYGKTLTLQAVVTGAPGARVEWVSYAPDLATVNGGKVTARKLSSPAQVVVEAWLRDMPDVYSYKQINIVPPTASVVVKAQDGRTSLDINDARDSICLRADCTPQDVPVTWKTSSAAIASVDENGVVRPGTKTGTATITATAADGSGKKGTIKIKVGSAIRNLTLAGESSVRVGKTVKLTAAPVPADTTDRTFVWKSSDPAIATVSSAGAVKGVAPGTAVITATSAADASVYASFDVQIIPSVASIAITGAGDGKVDMNASPQVQLGVLVLPQSLPQTAVWKSSSAKVATVDANGLVTFIKPGTVTITATAADGSGKKATQRLTAAATATGVVISGSDRVAPGKSTRLSAAVLPGAAPQKVVWSSSDVSVLTVSSAGVVKASAKAVAGQSAQIVAAVPDGSVSAAYTVSVCDAVGSLVIVGAPDEVDLTTDAPTFVLAVQDGATGDDTCASWKSSSAKVAAVDAVTGEVRCLAPGTATITATAGDGSGKKAAHTLRVTASASALQPAGDTDVVLGMGKTVALKANVLPANAVDKAIRWHSSDPAVATVSSSGAVKGVSCGTAIITAAHAAGFSVQYTVRVKPAVTKVTVVGSRACFNLNADTSPIALEAQVQPQDAHAAVVWSSSNPALVAVDQNGVATLCGGKAGTVTITAAAQDGSNRKGTLRLSVVEGPSGLTILGAENLTVGSKTTLSARVLPTKANKTVLWLSSDPAVAAVSASGVVTAYEVDAPTDVVITAVSRQDPAVTAAHALTVLPKLTELRIVADVTGDPGRHTMAINRGETTLQLRAVAFDDDRPVDVTWTCPDEWAGSVDGTGLVTATDYGTMVVSATAKDGSGMTAQRTIRVIDGVTSVQVDGDREMKSGQTQTLRLTVLPADTPYPSVTWRSSAPDVAAADAEGNVTAGEVSVRTQVTITATSDENEAAQGTFTLDVLPKPDFSIAGDDTLIDGGTVQLSACPDDGAQLPQLRWSVTQGADAATVDGNGLVTVANVTARTALVIRAQDAQDADVYCEHVLTVYPMAMALAFAEDRLELCIGETVTPAVRPTPADALDRFRFTTDDAAVAIVNSDGSVTATGMGATALRVQALDGSGLQAECVIAVAKSAEADFEYTPNYDGTRCTITDYHGKSAVVVVPDTLGGCIVSGVGDSAFAGDTGLRQVTLPDTVAIINDYAFAGCTALQSMDPGDGVITIRQGAFKDCTALTSFVWPEAWRMGPDDDEDGPFAGCTSLKTLTVADNVNRLPDNCFAGLTALETISLPESYVMNYYGQQYSHTLAASSATHIEVRGEPTAIAEGAFKNCVNLQTISLPATVEEMRASVFEGCTSLREITLPAAVTTLGNGLFKNCTGLVKVVYSSTAYTSQMHIGTGLFEGCTSLAQAEVAEGVTHLPHVFAGVPSITSVKLPSTLRYLEGSFQNCTGLTSLTLPASVSGTFDDPYLGCTSLKTVYIGQGAQYVPGGILQDAAYVETVVLPESVEFIYYSAFKGCTSLKNINLPAGLREIWDNAFEDCTSLAFVDFPAGLEVLGSHAFKGCTSLASFTYPVGLKLARMSEGVVEIYADDPTEWYASTKGPFEGCTSLTSYTVPDGVARIAPFLFADTPLRSVTLPASLREIGSCAFANCTQLRSIAIPSAVSNLEAFAFLNCTSLAAPALPAAWSEVGSSACTVEWNYGTEYLYEIYASPFVGCNSISAFTLPQGMQAVPAYAFYGLGTLGAVTLPDGVQSIGEQAFLGTAIVSLRLPESVRTIHSMALHWYGALTTPIAELWIGPNCDPGSLKLPNKNVVIHCLPGTVAHGFAVNNRYPFLLDYRGDGHSYEPWHTTARHAHIIGYVCTQCGDEYRLSPVAGCWRCAAIFDRPLGGDVPHEYTDLVDRYAIDGNVYYRVELIREYKGVEPTGDTFSTFFYTDDKLNVVTDEETLEKLVTIHLFVGDDDAWSDVPGETHTLAQRRQSILSLLDTAQEHAQLANSIHTNDIAMEAVGEIAAAGLQLVWGNPAGALDSFKDALSDVTDEDLLLTLLEMKIISQMQQGCIDMADGYTARMDELEDTYQDNGYYDYDLCLKAIDYYAGAVGQWRATTDLSSDVIQEIIDCNSAFGVGLRNVSTMLSAVTEDEPIYYMVHNLSTALTKAVSGGDADSQDFLDIFVDTGKLLTEDIAGKNTGIGAFVGLYKLGSFDLKVAFDVKAMFDAYEKTYNAFFVELADSELLAMHVTLAGE